MKSLGSVTSSLTTGLAKAASVQARSNGLEHSETGSAPLRIVPTVDPAEEPSVNDRSLLAKLPSSVRCSLKERVSADYDLIGYDLHGQPSRAELDLAIAEVDAALAPAGKALTIKELHRLRLGTKSRELDEEDLRLQVAVYASELADFPPDVVTAAVRASLRQDTFFPPVSDLIERCHRANRVRESLASALKMAARR